MEKRNHWEGSANLQKVTQMEGQEVAELETPVEGKQEA